MASIYLPIHQQAKPVRVRDEKTGREMILIVPTVGYESRQHAEEVVMGAKERAVDSMRAQGAVPQRKLPRHEVGRILQDFDRHLREKDQRTAPNKYVSGWQ